MPSEPLKSLSIFFFFFFFFSSLKSFSFLQFIIIIGIMSVGSHSSPFSIREATISDIQTAFSENKLTSRQLVEFYLQEIESLNPLLHSVIEVNPNILNQADIADSERNERSGRNLGDLHGIPILLKDTISTKGDKLNTTAGSFALLGSMVPMDAGVVKRLRKSGALIMGKTSLSEWAYMRSFHNPKGWSARGGQGKNPYVLTESPGGSSSGSAISVAANMITVALGTDTHGSILCPSSLNSVVGIKPTVGLVSRSGVIPVAPRQDTVGPICRTVSDAVYVLDAIAGFDPLDSEATREAAKFIPEGGYKQFLMEDGLKGKRLGIVRDPFFHFHHSHGHGSILPELFQGHLDTLRLAGAVLVDNLEIEHVHDIINPALSGELTLMRTDFKISLNLYLQELITSPVRSLADVIAFNRKNPHLEKLDEYDQDMLIAAESTDGYGEEEKEILKKLEKLSRDGFEKIMIENKLDAMISPGYSAAALLAIRGFPGISVPAGYDIDGVPIGICFGGLKGSEPKLIEIAYAFEQMTMSRKPPQLQPIQLNKSTDRIPLMTTTTSG